MGRRPSIEAFEARCLMAAAAFTSAIPIGGPLINIGEVAGYKDDAANGHGNPVATDSSGNLYITGQFQGTVKFGTDASGAVVQRATVGSDPEIFVAKYAPSGTPVWVDVFHESADPFGGGGGGFDIGNALAVDSAGDVFVTGTFSDPVNFDPTVGNSQVLTPTSGGDDLFLLKLNADGTYANAVDFGSSGFDQGSTIAVDPAGKNVVVGGSFQNTIDFKPGTGSIDGELSTDSDSDTEAFVAKFNGNLSFIYAKDLTAGAQLANVNGVAIDSTGAVYATGSYLQGDSFEVNLNPDANQDLPAVDNGGYDIFLTKLDNTSIGNFVDAQSFGGSGDDVASGIAIDSKNNVYITGTFEGHGVDFNPRGHSYTLDGAGCTQRLHRQVQPRHPNRVGQPVRQRQHRPDLRDEQ